MKTFGLLGYPLQHSFSKAYFENKFEREGLSDYRFEHYETRDLGAFMHSLPSRSNLVGFSVTIPYKKEILQHLGFLDPVAREVGAVNSVKVVGKADGQQLLEGYNTDVHGFTASLLPHLPRRRCRALVLGSGGASAAVQYSLRLLGIPFRVVSRSGHAGAFTYEEITSQTIRQHQLIVNTTPLGMFPVTRGAPEIPYEGIQKGHVLFDLIYNPPRTRFLSEGETRGAQVVNGKIMLELQAEKSWQLWTAKRTDDRDN